MKLRNIKIETPPGKWLIFLPFVFLAAIAFFVGRWAMGGTAATQLRLSEEPTPAEVAQVMALGDFAVNLAPDDPQPHLIVGSLEEKSFIAEMIDKSFTSYEKAAALAPDDYRYWVGYARAAARSDQPNIAERAAERALELAPNYGVTNWTLANIYLRNGKLNEAFAYLRQAVISEPLYAPTTFGLILDRNNDDAEAITKFLGDSAEINRIAFAFFAKQKRVNDTMNFWRKLSAEQKSALSAEFVRDVKADLIGAKGFRAVLEIDNARGKNSEASASVGVISNGGFESNFLTANPQIFDWRITEGDKPEIGANLEDKHGGNQSMILAFRRVRTEFRSIEQTVAVESNKHYRLDFFAKATNLKAEYTVKVEVVDANTDQILGSSAPVAAGTTDWQSLNAEFTTGAETQGVKIRLSRMPCGIVGCEINGFLRFDDFSLTAF